MARPPKKPFCYEYPRPAVTVDVVIVTKGRPRRVLLVKRRQGPFAGAWALPGGFIEMDESLDAAARRELYEETGVRAGQLEQLHTFGEPDRDPRGRTITVAYLAVVNPNRINPQAADDAAEVGWHRLDGLPRLAFDHALVLALARKRLRRRR